MQSAQHVATADLPRLDNLNVAITHTWEQAEDQQELLHALGANVYCYPAIDIVPFAENQELDDALHAAARGEYDWLILNDADTVLVISERLRKLKIEPRALAGTKIATISCMTEVYTQEMLGLQSDFAPVVYTPRSVADSLNLGLGDRVLLPQSARTRASLARCLAEQGADVDAINAYRTLIGHGGDPVPVMLWEGKIDVITFAFPTAVRYFSKRIKFESGSLDMLDDVCVACLGPITAAAAAEMNIKVAVMPADHTIGGMIRGIQHYFIAKS